ncbi:MAG: Response regulator of zinc sigma-54-dependent two-component system [uncultured Thiotrichaceae bacterium]|uniref:Response regulator of zinc sigma-54-dependent two-component system n=1 Tax=uncultured Thiotrichaceae bacterium TaxID=298394 RepID=A0A6S6TIU0_9GAMM|nr:MAG: Response regulator of zinc sigma-54-dependent two-component system [uncultured Thiotrichaceae bacterium]
MMDMNTSGQANILLIDDEPIALSNMQHILEKSGYQVAACKDGESGLNELQRQSFDLVLTDLKMPGIDGMDVLAHIRENLPDVPVIMITGHASLDSAVEAMKLGAYHYISKPFRLNEMREMIKGALELRRVKVENQELKEKISSLSDQTTIITQDIAMQRVLETARKIAATDTSVIIHGESGTGKELMARFLHDNSTRIDKPFVAFNCGALHEEIAASELFGHEKGAFTGATSRKLGLFEAAEGGTLFLDEVAEMPLLMQVKLLRVLQERELMRVGSTVPVPINVRVVAASNRDLKQAVDEGEMRNDLYFRLNVVTLTLPPLRDRREDIPFLAYYFLRKFSTLMKLDVLEISTEAMKRLVEYNYPGNIRELSNFIERGVVLSQSEVLDIEHLPQSLGSLTVRVFAPEKAATPATLEDQQKEHILNVLEMTDGNRTEAAKMLGIDRVSLWRKLKKLGIDGNR